MLINCDKNVFFQMSLQENISKYSSPYKDDTTWFKVNFELYYNGETIKCHPLAKSTIDLRCVTYLISNLSKFCKASIEELHQLKPFKFSCGDDEFRMNFDSNGLEDDIIEVELWFPIEVISSYQIEGFCKGVKFLITQDSLKCFKKSLEDSSVIKSINNIFLDDLK